MTELHALQQELAERGNLSLKMAFKWAGYLDPSLREASQDWILSIVEDSRKDFDIPAEQKSVANDNPLGAANVREYHNLFPIPQAEIAKNGNLSPNNTGY